jgi:hypothetical protein
VTTAGNGNGNKMRNLRENIKETHENRESK